MQQQQKQDIQKALQAYCDKYKSQNAAANSTGISSATISQILNNNWELIKDDMWRKVAASIKFNKTNWQVVETSVYIKAFAYIGDSKRNPDGIRAIIAKASMGKSIAIDAFTTAHENAYYIRCHRSLGVKHLLRDMLKAMGKESSGSAIEMLESLVNYLERDNQPLFIIDEVDKLKDEVLEMFIDIENKLHKQCGLVFTATPYLQKRIEAGVSKGKRGFSELYSRMKKYFWDLTPTPNEFKKDVATICKANRVTSEATIIEFTNKSDFDFRVLTDLITAYKNQ